jgi:hypothetical protein
MVEVQTSEVDALPTPFSLAQQWVGIDKNWVSMVTPLTKVYTLEVDAILHHSALFLMCF